MQYASKYMVACLYESIGQGLQESPGSALWLLPREQPLAASHALIRTIPEALNTIWLPG